MIAPRSIPSSKDAAGRRVAIAVGGREADVRRRVDLLERDGAILCDLQLPQVGDDDAGVFAGDVSEDHVALRAAGRALGEDDFGDLGGLEELQRPGGPAAAGHDPELDYGLGGCPCKMRCSSVAAFPRS